MAKAMVVATTAANSPITPTITARLGGNESVPRMPMNANATAAHTKTIPTTKKKLPSIRSGSYPGTAHRRQARA
jgi:hypothetical protein